MPYRLERTAASLVIVLSSAACAGCAERSSGAVSERDDADHAASLASTSAEPAQVPDATMVEGAPPDAASPDAAPTANTGAVTTTRFLSMIYEHPSFASFHMGWFRAGARVKVVERVPPGPNVSSCPRGWWKVDPVGYVCEGGKEGVTTDFTHPHVVAMAKYQAKRGEPLPYGYAMSNGAHFYGKIPSDKEQHAIESDLDAHLKRVAAEREKTPDKYALALPVEPAPSFLEGGGQAPQLYAWSPQGKVVRAGYATFQTRLGLVAAFEANGRNFYLTTEAYVVPADRLKTHKLVDFRGMELALPGAEEGARLPVFAVRYGNPAMVWKVEDVAGADAGAASTPLAKPTDKKIPVRGFAEIADKPLATRNGPFFEILHADRLFGADVEPGVKYLVRPSEGTRIDGSKEKPERIGDSEVWVEVRTGTQVLIVYEGLTPRYVTLVSTGAGKKHETPHGQFRVYQKHVTTKMSAEEIPAEEDGGTSEKAYRYDDVGYTQFIFEGIALHTAFWHEGFGLPRSHGCINLAPRDAAWIFEKTLPRVPDGWHGMSSGRGGVPWGTMVWIRF